MKTYNAHPASSRLWPWSLAALCALGFVLFLIALTIVLSLIPVYLSRRDISLSNGSDLSDLFYLEYATTADNGSTGFANNLGDVSQQLNSQLGLPSNTIDVEQVEIRQVTNSKRRRRSRVNILNRGKRTINCHVLISCQARYPSSCTSKSCRTAFFSLIERKCSEITDISLQLALVSLGGSLVQFALQFLGFSLTVPADFAALDNTTVTSALSETTTTTTTSTEASTTAIVIIAAQSGLFRLSSTWIGGKIPVDGSCVIIPQNITVSIDDSMLTVAIDQIQIGGTLQIGYQSPGPFIFASSFNIVIVSTGSLVDATTGSTNGFSLQFNSAFICYSGGQYIGKSTSALITARDSNGNIVSVGSPVTLSGTVIGPWSLLVDMTGLITFQSHIVLLALASGDLNDEESWCGGLQPPPSICELNGGCDLTVPSDVTLSITDVDNQLSLPITKWVIYGTLSLGGSDLQTGFYFDVPCEVIIENGGTLVDLTTGNQSGLYFPDDSRLVVYPNATVIGQGSVSIYSYQLGNIDNVTENVKYGSTGSPSISGPFTIFIDVNTSSITNSSEVILSETSTTSTTNSRLIIKTTGVSLDTTTVSLDTTTVSLDTTTASLDTSTGSLDTSTGSLNTTIGSLNTTTEAYSSST